MTDEILEFKCPGCGNTLFSKNAVNGLVTCDFCFMPRAVPVEKPDPAALKLIRDGENELLVCDFARAEAFFRKAAALAPKEPLVFWNIALARFCVQYIKDEVNGRVQPICHEISQELFCESEEYKRAIALADLKQREAFEAQGREIDEIRRKFFALKDSGLTYDCFLCVKVTDEKGGRTSDYKDADDIYFELRGKGFSPFFSERSLAGKAGTDYEAHILYALATSGSMLVICHDERYLNTPWVRNEYTRFLRMIGSEDKESDALSIAFRGKVVERLPGKQGKLQGIDLSTMGAMPRIFDFVERHTAAGRERLAREKREKENELKRKMEEQERKLNDLKNRMDYEAPPKSAPSEEALRLRKEAEKLFVIEGEVLVRFKGVKRGEEESLPEKISKKVNTVVDTVTDTVNTVMSSFGLAERQKKNAPLDPASLKKIEVPSFITEIGEEAFLGCENIEEIVLPKNLRYLHDRAFSGCKNLKKINFPNGLVTVGEGAFAGCESLGEAILPNTVVELGKKAFYGCKRMASAAVSNCVTSIREETFADCHALRTVALSDRLSSIYDAAFARCSSLVHVTVPFVTDIGAYAFAGCASLKGVEVSHLLEHIRTKAFYGCKSLRQFEIANYGAKVGALAFYGCKRLKTIYCAVSDRPERWHKDWNVKGRFIFKYRVKTYWGVTKTIFNSIKQERENQMREQTEAKKNKAYSKYDKRGK